MRTLRILIVALLCALSVGTAPAQQDVRGQYFEKKHYVPSPLPRFEELKAQLPSPIFDEKPLWVRTYWAAWELAFQHFHEPDPRSGFVSQFIDAAFNRNIFLFDTCFMAMFCKYGHPLVPGIESLDNFYARQHADGEICREIGRADGVDHSEWVNQEDRPLFSRWGWNLSGPVTDRITRPVKYVGRALPKPNPRLTLDALNHPVQAWAELDSYRLTGDRTRLAAVWEPLSRYYQALQKYLRQGNGLYITDWASMDNSPRNVYLIDGGTAIDTSAEMVLFARSMAEIGSILGKRKEARGFAVDAAGLEKRINTLMWDQDKRFYFDLTLDGKRAPMKTIGAYWTLISGVASPSQAEALAGELSNPKTFGRLHRVPSCSADAPGYSAEGAYWRGAVWVPTNTMVIRGLEKYGNHKLAREIALEHVARVAELFDRTGTIWENYAPDSIEPGKPARRDFVGWSGLGPIMYLIQYGIGFDADAQRNEIIWRLESPARTGCERFRFNGHVVTLIAEPAGAGPRAIRVTSDSPFRLRVLSAGGDVSFRIHAGENSLVLSPGSDLHK